MSDTDEDYTSRDLARMLHLSVDTIEKHLRAGRIPGYQLGGKGSPWLIDRTTYADWKASLGHRGIADGPMPDDAERIEPRSARSQARLKRSA